MLIRLGAQDFLEIANHHHGQKMRLIRQIQTLDFDYLSFSISGRICRFGIPGLFFNF